MKGFTSPALTWYERLAQVERVKLDLHKLEISDVRPLRSVVDR